MRQKRDLILNFASLWEDLNSSGWSETCLPLVDRGPRTPDSRSTALKTQKVKTDLISEVLLSSEFSWSQLPKERLSSGILLQL